MSKLIDFESYPISPVLDRLLQDKTTKQNICWNFWQMDGLTGTIPFSIPKQEEEQITLLDFFDNVVEEQQLPIMPICRVMDWRKDCSISYDTIRGGKSE